MPDSVRTRKGASKASLIPENVLALLHAGELESVNLTEWQAVDHIHLLRSVLPHVQLGAHVSQLVDQLEETGSTSGMKAIRLIGQELLAILHESGEPTATSPFSYRWPPTSQTVYVAGVPISSAWTTPYRSKKS